MKAITTRFLSPTESRGARIKASCEAGTFTSPYDYALDGQAAHRQVAEELVRRLGWSCGPLLGGHLANGDYVFVFDNEWSRK